MYLGLLSVYLFLPSTNHKNHSIYFSNRRHKGMGIIEVGQWFPGNYAFKSIHSVLKNIRKKCNFGTHCFSKKIWMVRLILAVWGNHATTHAMNYYFLYFVLLLNYKAIFDAPLQHSCVTSFIWQLLYQKVFYSWVINKVKIIINAAITYCTVFLHF